MANVTLALLKEASETDDESSKVASENTKLPSVNGGNLPAQLDHEIDVLLQATARSNPIMLWKDENNYRIGEDQRELGRKYVAHTREWFRGYVRWQNGEIVDPRLKRAVDDPTVLPREAMGHNDKSKWEDPDKDPVCFMNYLPLTDLETGEFVVFSSPTTGGKIAIEKLCNEYAREIRSGRKSGEPIIRLARGTFKTRFGDKPRPDFPISGWVDQELIEKDSDDTIPF